MIPDPIHRAGDQPPHEKRQAPWPQVATAQYGHVNTPGREHRSPPEPCSGRRGRAGPRAGRPEDRTVRGPGVAPLQQHDVGAVQLIGAVTNRIRFGGNGQLSDRQSAVRTLYQAGAAHEQRSVDPGCGQPHAIRRTGRPGSGIGTPGQATQQCLIGGVPHAAPTAWARGRKARHEEKAEEAGLLERADGEVADPGGLIPAHAVKLEEHAPAPSPARGAAASRRPPARSHSPRARGERGIGAESTGRTCADDR